MDGGRSDGGGGELEVEDEFACAGMLRGSLASLHSSVERIFGVTFGIGVDDLSQRNNGQIWLKLRGEKKNVNAAKLFVKGVVNQEEQQEVSYPGVLHCVFCGARGLFLDCLIKSTSAHIVVGSPGFLLISGLAEPVVRAYSLITDLVERYEGTQSRRPETGDRGSGESLDSRRAFKTLVEKWEDRHTLDLLVLPGSVKEILLDLVKESGLGSSPMPLMTDGHSGARSVGDSEGRWDRTTERWVEGMTADSMKDSKSKDFLQFFSTSAGARGRAEGAEERPIRSPQEVGEEEQVGPVALLGTKVTERGAEKEEQDLQLSVGNKEFWLLLKFFTAMGYTEDVVKRVLARTGPKEASQILDLVQQEQDRWDHEQAVQREKDQKNQDSTASNKREGNRPCETEHREDAEMEAAGDKVRGSNGEVGEEGREGEGDGATGNTRHFEGEGRAEDKEEGHEEDFVLGVLKKAAASCGYMEQNVAKVYNMLRDGSTHQLLVELQKEENKENDAFREGPREMDDVVLEVEGLKVRPAEDEAREETDIFKPAKKQKHSDVECVQVPSPPAPAAEPDLFTWNNKHQQPFPSHYTSQEKRHQPSKSQTQHQAALPEVKGPPMPIYPSSLDSPHTNFPSSNQFVYLPNSSNPKQNHKTQDTTGPKPHFTNSLKKALQAPQPPIFRGKDLSPSRASERRGVMAASSVVVTGEQRFLEGLETPFDLQLTDNPGNPNLRTIIIDGSNVAMSHGLGHFFSCRGIALAVQHFWDRGHRKITALLPQWRQKFDRRITEQHYLTELQKLGLLAYTPSREFEGKRISSYDDRLMLQHAQKTRGVIVTNDNLRDLSDETNEWRDIIKKSLLQYTFVGDHFMVPDDPLGRGGPHLDDFLSSDRRTHNPGNHTSACVATNFPSSKPPRSQTEVLNFRDRTLGGALDASHVGSRAKGRGHGKGWDEGHQHRPFGALGAERSAEETANLREQLCQVFPGQDNMVALVLQCHPAETDINVLSEQLLEQQND